MEAEAEAEACRSVEKLRACRGQLEDQLECHSGILDGNFDRDYQNREDHDGGHRLGRR
jgi:hypothetical protein